MPKRDRHQHFGFRSSIWAHWIECLLNQRLGLMTVLGVLLWSLLSCLSPSWGQPSLGFDRLPQPQVHPLPPLLKQWHDRSQSGDYFDQVKPLAVGYLIWSQFPVQVFVSPLLSQAPSRATSASLLPEQAALEQKWQQSVGQAIADWQKFFPLVLTASPETADITIQAIAARITSPRHRDRTRTLEIPRIQSGQTRYELYWKPAPPSQPTRLSHRCFVLLNPRQPDFYITAAARH